MKNIKRAGLAATLLSLALMTGVMTACTNDPVNETVTLSDAATSISMVVQGYEWGPAVPKVIVEFSDNVTGTLNTSTFTVKTVSTTRTVTDVYLCDSDGDKVTSDSKYVAIEMTVAYSSMSSSGEASPFTYGWTTSRNEWSSTYKVKLTLPETTDLQVGGKSCAGGDTVTLDAINNRIVPDTAVFDKDSYTYTANGANITLNRAAYTPDGAATDGGKNPLVIWLHGAGEGGDDVDIALLGNEVTALAESEIQSYFTDSSCAGAYVLAVQSPTMWMDIDGTGTYNNSATGEKQTSYYTEALYAAITDYVSGNSDIDTDRIIIGGCSNGGYMTMNMMFEYGDYFAAFYPICEAYLNANITDAMIEQVKDYNIWFLQSEDDTTVDPTSTTIPTFYRLIQAGAQNVHFTLTDHVYGVDSEGTTYMGHWSWIYTFNDGVKTEFDNSAVLANGLDYVTNSNCTKTADFWTWVAAQVKTAAVTPSGTAYTFEAESAVLGTADNIADYGEYAVYYTTGVEACESASGNYSVGYFAAAGNTITYTITSDVACTATVTITAASASSEFDWSTLISTIVDVDGSAVGFTVNGESVTLSGTLSGNADGNYYNWGSLTASISLQAGENTIVLTCTGTGVNVDCMVITTEGVLTWTETNNLGA